MRTKTDDNAVRKAILEAAEKEFLSVGYAGAKTLSIAQKAGVTHTMLHYYFQTKENLFQLVLQSKFALIQQVFNVFMAQPELPILERVAAIVRKQFDILAKQPALPRFLVNEVLVNETTKKAFQQNIPVLREKVYEPLQADLDRAADARKIRPVKAVDLIFAVVSLNSMTLMLMPAFEAALNGGKKMRKADMQARKEMNVELVLNMLKK